MLTLLFSLACIATLLYKQVSLLIWTAAGFVVLLLISRLTTLSVAALIFWWTLFLVMAIIFNGRGVRRKLISQHLLPLYRSKMPSLSDTEQQALLAGTVGFEGELFQGRIDWTKHFNTPLSRLTASEQAFIDGPLQTLCQQIDDWHICQQDHDLPASMWDFLKTAGFFGLIIPTEYGGLGFSSMAHSEILLRLYSRSTAVATTVGVPNSLGPAELLLHYGTLEQKQYYLPRLAKGLELPCFALTGPEAGSDAGAMTDYGVVCRDVWQGQETLGIRLNWNKRYITLAPIATVLGLAFKLVDPDHLLSEQSDRGICCALIPTKLSGIVIGRRHNPLNIAFQNGPTQGHDVFIPLSCLIGGEAMIGQGWRMLVECLAVGRAITLPASAISGSKMFAAVSGAYACLRRQFNTTISQFEGIQQPLARLARCAYFLDAARQLVLSSIDRGEKPAIVSAMIKYHSTEAGRLAAMDAMDIHGGKGICLGPNNYLANFYQGSPIAITVEGANILTRNLIIFGQGAIRCHPFILTELQAAGPVNQKQPTEAKSRLQAFDRALFNHLGYSLSNISRSLMLSLSGGFLTRSTETGLTKRYAQKITRLSANFALAADSILWVLGAQLKRREAISARLADVFSHLYFSAATLKQFKADGQPVEDQALVHYCCQYLLHQAEQQLSDLLNNLTPRWLAWTLRVLIFPLGRQCPAPSDALQQQVAHYLLSVNPTRERIIRGIDNQDSEHNAIYRLNTLLKEINDQEGLEKRLRQGIRDGKVSGRHFLDQIQAAAKQGLITLDEATDLTKLEQARQQAIQVDDFNANWQ